MAPRRLVALALVSLVFAAVPLAAAENEGLPDLDQAIELKLAAGDLSDLTRVIELCNQALDKGLDEEHTQFADQLLASTLVQRGTMFGDAVFRAKPGDLDGLRKVLQLRLLALRDLEQAVDHDVTQAEAHLAIARLHAFPGGDRQRALTALDLAVQHAGKDNGVRAEALALRGNMHPDPVQSALDYTAALAIDPTNIDVRRARAELYFEQGKLESALEDLDKVIELDADHAGTHQARGLVLADLERWEDAVKALDRALELDPEGSQSFLHRARVHMQLGHHDQALADLDKSIQLSEPNPAAMLLRAEIYVRTDKPDRAKAEIAQVLHRWPGLPPALRARAILAAAEGKYRDAIADLEDVRRADPENVQTLLQLAQLYRATGDVDRTLKTYQQAIRLDESSAAAYRGRADAYIWVGKHDEAIADYEQAIELNESSASTINNLAWLLATSPDDDVRDGARALKLAERACELTDYKAAYILSTLAACHAELGDFESAVEWAAKAVELADEDDLKSNIAKELASYKDGKPWRERKAGPGDPAARTANRPDDSPENQK